MKIRKKRTESRNDDKDDEVVVVVVGGDETKRRMRRIKAGKKGTNLHPTKRRHRTSETIDASDASNVALERHRNATNQRIIE